MGAEVSVTPMHGTQLQPLPHAILCHIFSVSMMVNLVPRGSAKRLGSVGPVCLLSTL